MRQSCKRTIKECLKEKSGTTLVELMVTFALIGLFMTAAMAMLTSSLQMFGRMQTTSSAVNVSDLILDKIAGEIAAADIPEAGSTSGYYFWLEPTSAGGKSRWVVFRNRSRSPIAIFAGESGSVTPDEMGKGQLFVKYYAVSKADQKAVEEIDWHFDKKVYAGYNIKELYFEQEDKENHPNVVKISLIIANERTGFEYASYRYAECYNYDGMYLSERDDEKTNFPADKGDGLTGAVEFEIKNSSGGGGDGPEEPEEPEEPLPDGWIQLTIIHKVVDEYGGEVLLTEFVKWEYKQYDPWIPAHPLYPDKLPEYTTNQGYVQVPVEPSDKYVTYTYYYTPKDTPYCFAAYDVDTNQLIKKGDVRYNKHGVEVEVFAENIANYRLAGEQTGIKRALKYTNDNPESNIIGGPNEFRFYYKKVIAPYTVYHKCGDILLDLTEGSGALGETIGVQPKSFSQYSPIVGEGTFILNNPIENSYEFQYIMNSQNFAPFQPVGPYIDITISPEREPDIETKAAQDIFKFFFEDWKKLEVYYSKPYMGGYRVFELAVNGKMEKYAIAGWSNVNGQDNILLNELEKKGIARENVIDIGNNRITDKFIEFILKNAGADDSYMENLNSIKLTFDEYKHLSRVTYQNTRGEKVTIIYKK